MPSLEKKTHWLPAVGEKEESLTFKSRFEYYFLY